MTRQTHVAGGRPIAVSPNLRAIKEAFEVVKPHRTLDRLAAHLGCSRSTLKRALRPLQARGRVVYTTRYGWTITDAQDDLAPPKRFCWPRRENGSCRPSF